MSFQFDDDDILTTNQVDDDTEGDENEEEVDPLKALKNAQTNEQYFVAWNELSEDVEEQAIARGYNPPVSADDSGFVGKPPGHPMHETANKQAEASVKAFLANVGRGNFPVDPETLEDIKAAWESTRVPPSRQADQWQALQRAGHLVESARAAAFELQPFRATSRRTFVDQDRSMVTIESDGMGRQREVSRYSAAEVEAAQEAAHAPPKDFGDVKTLADVEGWSTQKLMELRQAEPETFDLLKRQESKIRDKAARERRYGISV